MMGMSDYELKRAVAMWGIALCLFAAAAGWMFMRFGMAWSIADLPPSTNMDFIVPAYIISEVAMISLGGKLVDSYGTKKVLVFAPTIFILGSMLCMLSVSVEALIIFRFIQGIGGGLILAVAFAAVGKYYSPKKRGKCHELMTGSFAFGSLFGSAMGYFFTSNLNWRFGFIFFSVIAFIGFMMAWRLLPESEGDREPTDPISVILTTLMFGAAALYTQTVNIYFDLLSFNSLIFAAIIVLLLVLMMKNALKVPDAITPMGKTWFERKLIILMFMFSLCGLGLIQYFFKLYLTYYEFDIYEASFMFIFLILGAAGPSIIGCRKVFDTGIRPWVTVGAIIVTISLVIAHFMADQGKEQFALSLFIFGFGLGCIVTEILCSMQAVIKVDKIGQHTGNLMAIRMIGILVGNAIVGAYIKDVVDMNHVAPYIDANTSKSLLFDILKSFVDNIKYAAQSLDSGLMATLLIMAVVTALLAYVGFKIGKDDLEELKKEE